MSVNEPRFIFFLPFFPFFGSLYLDGRARSVLQLREVRGIAERKQALLRHDGVNDDLERGHVDGDLLEQT